MPRVIAAVGMHQRVALLGEVTSAEVDIMEEGAAIAAGFLAAGATAEVADIMAAPTDMDSTAALDTVFTLTTIRSANGPRARTIAAVTIGAGRRLATRAGDGCIMSASSKCGSTDHLHGGAALDNVRPACRSPRWIERDTRRLSWWR
jgi:hypothetical protein